MEPICGGGWDNAPHTDVVAQSRSRVWLFVTHRLQHTRLPCPCLPTGVCSNSWPLNGWSYLTISSSATLFFCLQSFTASGSFPMCQLFPTGTQSIGASASASVLPVQGWFPWGLTGLISLLSKGLSYRCPYPKTQNLWIGYDSFGTSMDCSPPGSSLHGIFQARIPELVAISSSRGSCGPIDKTHVSCVFSITGRFFTSHWGSPNRLP